MNMNHEEGIDLLELARALWRNILAIALVAVLFGGMAFGYTAFMVSPTYKATTSLYVNSSTFSVGQTNISVSASQLNTSSSLVSVYLYILKSRTTMEDVIKEAGLTCSPSALSGMISARAVSGTSAFEVTVTSSDPAQAELIANTVAKVLPERISEIVDGSSVRIVDYAVIPSQRSGPDLMANTQKGMLIGAALCAALVVLQFLLTNSTNTMIKSTDELRSIYPDIMVLASIPDMRYSEKKNAYYSSYYGAADKKKKGGKENAGSKGA